MTGIELHKLGYTDIHALDISQEMLNIAKEKGVPYKRFVCTPLTEQSIEEFETGEFDALISAGVLVKAHVRPAAFVEIIRMVKTGKTGLSYGKIGNLFCFAIFARCTTHFQFTSTKNTAASCVNTAFWLDKITRESSVTRKLHHRLAAKQVCFGPLKRKTCTDFVA